MADFSSVEKFYLKNDIQLDVITLGGEMKCAELIELCDKTGGHMYTIEDMGELSRLYYDIYFNNNISTTDSDGDKLYDVVEINGIRLKNGQVIYTDPYEADTDGDGLLDGEEIIPEIVFTPISLTLKKSSYRFYYNWKSDPTNPDSDGDGIGDAKDNRPFQKGFYSKSAGKVVVGELTIVSSMYNGVFGHAYLLYQSYIDDRLGLYGLAGGYEISIDDEKKASYRYVYSSWKIIEVGEYITLGNSSLTMGSDTETFETKWELDDMDASGVYYNREIAVDILECKEVYDKNSALSIEVTKEQMEDVITYHRSRNYYNAITNNCAIVAINSWNRISPKEKFDVTISPVTLRCYIMNRRGSFSVDLLKCWGIK